MIGLIASVIMLVLLAVLVAFNAKFTTSISLFGAVFDQVPTIALALISFALGIIYSLFLYASWYLHRRKRRGLERRGKALAQRERELASRESDAVSATDATQGSPAVTNIPAETRGQADESPPAPKKKWPRFFERFKIKS